MERAVSGNTDNLDDAEANDVPVAGGDNESEGGYDLYENHQSCDNDASFVLAIMFTGIMVVGILMSIFK